MIAADSSLLGVYAAAIAVTVTFLAVATYHVATAHKGRRARCELERADNLRAERDQT